MDTWYGYCVSKEDREVMNGGVNQIITKGKTTLTLTVSIAQFPASEAHYANIFSFHRGCTKGRFPVRAPVPDAVYANLCLFIFSEVAQQKDPRCTIDPTASALPVTFQGSLSLEQQKKCLGKAFDVPEKGKCTTFPVSNRTCLQHV